MFVLTVFWKGASICVLACMFCSLYCWMTNISRTKLMIKWMNDDSKKNKHLMRWSMMFLFLYRCVNSGRPCPIHLQLLIKHWWTFISQPWFCWCPMIMSTNAVSFYHFLEFHFCTVCRSKGQYLKPGTVLGIFYRYISGSILIYIA